MGIAASGATDAARAAADVVLLAPGLSVIVTAIRTAREIFQRMTTYAIYRIAETIRVLLLITLSILIFDFFPVTPVMIVLLALLNDGAILSIADHRAEGSERPEAWDMTTVLSIVTVLGVIGVVASFSSWSRPTRSSRWTDPRSRHCSISNSLWPGTSPFSSPVPVDRSGPDPTPPGSCSSP